MKIYPHSCNFLYQENTRTKNQLSIPNFAGSVGNGTDSVKISFKSDAGSSPSKLYLAKTKFLNKLLNRPLCQCDLEKLEGIQNGLKTFEGLSLKQIAFAMTNLHSINMISGCTRHCVHCYANSQPDIKRYSFEDFKQIMDDIKALSSRVGTKVVHHYGQEYVDCGFDTDALDCHLYDKDGNKHDFVEIAALIKKSTGYGPVFDTNGWSARDEEKQKIASDYVKRLLENDNYKNFYQINVSINPFSPVYVRAVNSGYPIKSLYQPFMRVDVASLEKEQSLPEDFKRIRDEYTGYIKDTANVLMTFKPLLKTGKLAVLTRVLDNKITQMTGFRCDDFITTINHIYTQLDLYHQLWGDISKEELKQFENLLSDYSTRMFSSGRMEKFYKAKTGSLNGIEQIDEERVHSKKRLEKLKDGKGIKATNLRYLKMITPDGKVYMYDNYALIPTDIQLKTSLKNLEKPFKIKVEDFVVTQDMIDLF